jgi:predicted lactoylglutathione lyase
MAYLGNVSQITIGTSDLAESVAFYEKMGFRVVNQNTKPNPWAQVTDDTILILLNQDAMQYIGFTYFNPQMADIVNKLKKAEVPIIMEIENIQVIFSSPSGFWISLINYDASSMFQPAGQTLADIPQSDWANAPAPNADLGIFGELATPVEDLDKEIAFWEMIGFKVSKFGGPYPWAIGQDGQNVIGLHNTSEFDRSAITFFAKDMADKIKALKEKGLDSFDPFGGTGGNNDANQILNTPEGQRFFLFSF